MDPYYDRTNVRTETRTDLEARKRDLLKDPDWTSYRPVERQSEVDIYSTGVPRTKFRRIPEQSTRMEQVKASYGLGSASSEIVVSSGREACQEEQPRFRLPSLPNLSPEQEAMEARPFLPPPTPERKDSAREGNLGAQYRKLKNDFATLKKKAKAEIDAAYFEKGKMARKLAAQKDLMRQQSDQITELTRQLQDMRRVQAHEVQQEQKKTTSSEKRAAALHRRIGELSSEHESAMAAASAATKRLQQERDALAMALAAVASQAVGGEEADPQAVSKEIEASVKEGNEPLPRAPQAWLSLRYTDASEAAPGKRSKKLAGDGVRAVAALVAQVRRLWKKRSELSSAEAHARGKVEKLTQIIRRVDVEYQGISDSIAVIERAAEQLKSSRGMDIPVARDASLPSRLRTVQAVLHKLAAEVDRKERELVKLKAHHIENEFYSRLHGSQDNLAASPQASQHRSQEVAEKPTLDTSDSRESDVQPVNDSMEAPSNPYSDDVQEKIAEMQANSLLNNHSQERESNGHSLQLCDNGSSLPRLEDFSEEDQAKIVKIQAQGRGYIARKRVKDMDARPSSVQRGGEAKDLPRLEDFSEEDQARIVKIQAQGRGYIARKRVKTMNEGQQFDQQDEQAEELPRLEDFSEEDQA
eukprot:CAMPEP_0177587352 /NCGR_PEP_ID=MMETSP0419_2-20121207/5596_1 /TAXON_ID=582737 /ORGANISM="Tetraselmis sp., Strain GSL018" /LENGTH=640 /DNA_ID=CAMNT_0019077377 /DNA_START=377 /DNA_END=2296 /DNA_ORIENTATION=-